MGAKICLRKFARMVIPGKVLACPQEYAGMMQTVAVSPLYRQWTVAFEAPLASVALLHMHRSEYSIFA